MKFFVRKILNVEEGEGFRVTLMFLYIFLIIATLLIVKPARNSLFLIKFGYKQLPYVFILVALFAAIITQIYSKYFIRVRLNKLILNTLFFCIFSLFLFWLLLHLEYEAGWFLYVFYVWVAIYGVLTTSQFWLLANYVFNAREAKRLFSIIGAGAISGGIFGGYLTNWLTPVISTKNMLFICIGFLLLCSFILTQIWRRSVKRSFKEKLVQQKRIKQEKPDSNPIKTILNSKHLTYVTILVGIGVVVANLVDYQYSAIASEKITNEDELTAFFGFWLSNLSVVSLFIQIFITNRILKYFGVPISLFFLPVGILIGAVAILFTPALWSAILIKVSDGSMKHSINKSGIELLMLPVPAKIKNQSKEFIDVFIDSLATGLVGIMLVILSNKMGLPVPYISVLVIGLIGVWMYAILREKKEYVDAFRRAIENRNFDFEAQNINIDDAAVFDSLIQILDGEDEKQIIYILKLIENVRNNKFIPHFKKLLYQPSAEIRAQVLKMLRRYDNTNLANEVNELVNDKNHEVRIEAIRYLFKFRPNGKDVVMNFLQDKDYRIRSAALMCVASEYSENEKIREGIDLNKLLEEFIHEVTHKDYRVEGLEFIKINLARLIGITHEPKLNHLLQQLLKDDSSKVRQSAALAAGEMRNPIFIPDLVNQLSSRKDSKNAQIGLANYGDEIADKLENYLTDSSQDNRIRRGVARTFSMIVSQKSVNVLINNYNQNINIVQYEILKSLNKLRIKFDHLKFDPQNIEQKVSDEISEYFEKLSLLISLNNFFKDEHKSDENQNDQIEIAKAQDLLLQAVSERLSVHLERIFRLLALIYPPHDMYNTYLGINSNRQELKMNAVEFLDNILSFKFKRVIIPIIESSSWESLKQYAPLKDKIKEFSGAYALKTLIEQDDNWLKSCALFMVSEKEISNREELIRTYITFPNAIVRETAKFALEKIEKN